jgi:hypothetical protein
MASARRAIGSMVIVMLKRAIRKREHRAQTSAYGNPKRAHTSIENIHTSARKSAGSTIPRNFNNKP